jgi:HAD superfamily hydrolase (TIGR01549 family)
MPPKITHILFDLGNTLLYFDGNWDQALERAIAAMPAPLREAGLEFDEPRFQTEFCAALKAYYARRDDDLIELTTLHILRGSLAALGLPPLPDTVLQTALAAFYAVTQAHWHAEPDALPTLRLLHARGIRMGVVSNAAWDADVQAQVDQHGLRGWLDFVLTSAAFGVRKPHPLIFQRALQHWHTAPGSALMVGDMLAADVLGAQRAGLAGVWLTRRANGRQGGGVTPDRVIGSLAELPGLLG